MPAETVDPRAHAQAQLHRALTGVASAPRADLRRRVSCRWLGETPYAAALAEQEAHVVERRAGRIPDQLLLLEHPHVFTLGASASPANVLLSEDERRLLGIELFDTGRGGDVTYHGPGQLVGYPILDLKPDRCDLHRYVRDLEEVLIRALAAFGVAGERAAGLTGVWVAGAKIAAIGVRVSSGWITSHGFAFNIATDLRFFDGIVPCGIRGRDVTSLEQVIGESLPLREAAESVAAQFGVVFDADMQWDVANTSRRT